MLALEAKAPPLRAKLLVQVQIFLGTVIWSGLALMKNLIAFRM
jgi:hypothetical protein